MSVKLVVESNLRSSLLVLASTLEQVFELNSPHGRIHSFPVLDKVAPFRLSGPRKAGMWSCIMQIKKWRSLFPELNDAKIAIVDI